MAVAVVVAAAADRGVRSAGNGHSLKRRIGATAMWPRSFQHPPEISFGLRVYRCGGFAYNRDPRWGLEVSVVILRKIVLKGPRWGFFVISEGADGPLFCW